MAASSHFAVLLMLIACAPLASSSAAGLRVGLKRIHSGRELASLDETLTATTRKNSQSGASYMMVLSIGSPPVPYPATIDTGSSIITALCAPCDGCTSAQPLYDPSSSSTFADFPCNSMLMQGLCTDDGDGGAAGCPQCTYNQTYYEGWTFITMGMETFTFDGGAAFPGVAFGCGNKSSGGWGSAAGLVGMGRGNLSLVSQLGAGKFSYCLTASDDANSTSTLLIGPSAALSNDTGVCSTPFVTNPSRSPQYYYLNLTGISLGAKALPIPTDAFALDSDGGGGLIIDSGWTATALVDVAYQEVRNEVLSLVSLPAADPSTNGDLCFQLPSGTSTPPEMPDMTLHFDGGADMVLPPENYMSLYDDSSLWCLWMSNTSASTGSVLGNYQQQNMHILYDLDIGMLSFAPADCSKI